MDNPPIRPNLYVYRNHAGCFWWCAIPYVDSKGRRRQRRRSFRDRKWGSKAASLFAAREWRDEAILDPSVAAARKSGNEMVLIEVNDPEDVDFSGTPFGLVGITVVFRDKPMGGNIVVTANRGRKKWYSMLRHGPMGAYKKAVYQRCKWIKAPVPDDTDLEIRFWHWAENHTDEIDHYGMSPMFMEPVSQMQ